MIGNTMTNGSPTSVKTNPTIPNGFAENNFRLRNPRGTLRGAGGGAGQASEPGCIGNSAPQLLQFG